MSLDYNVSPFAPNTNPPQNASYTRSLNLRDPGLKHIVAAKVEANFAASFDEDIMCYAQITGDVGGLDKMMNGRGMPKNHLPYAINRINMMAGEATFTIHKRIPQTVPMVNGDFAQRADNVRGPRTANATFLTKEWNSEYGLDIQNERYYGTLPYNELDLLEADLTDSVTAYRKELCGIVMCGRLGNSEDRKYWCFGAGNETYSAATVTTKDGRIVADESTQIQSHPDAYKFLEADNLKQPYERISPSQVQRNSAANTAPSGGNLAKAFRENPLYNPNLIDGDDKMTIEFLRHIAFMLREQRGNAGWRGQAFNQPTLFMNEKMKGNNDGGNYTRIPRKAATGVMLVNPAAEASLYDDTKWQGLQTAYAESQGVKNGWATGSIGDLMGMIMYRSPFDCRFNAGSNGGVEVARSVILGDGAMLEIVPRYPDIGSMYQNSIKKYTRNLAGAMFDFQLPHRGIGKESGLFWTSYLNYSQLFWKLEGSERPDGISNVIAVDTAISIG